MKKNTGILIFCVLILFVFNVFYYKITYKKELEKRTELLQNHISKNNKAFNLLLSHLESYTNLLISPKEFTDLFHSKNKRQKAQELLNILFNKYEPYIKDVNLIDLQGNSINLENIEKVIHLNTDTFKLLTQTDSTSFTFSNKKNNILITKALVNDSIYGYLSLRLDIFKFYHNYLNQPETSDNQFEWLINKNKKVIYNSYPVNNSLFSRQSINFNPDTCLTKTFKHSLIINHHKINALSSVNKLIINAQPYYLIVSIKLNKILDSLLVRNLIFIALTSLFLFTILLLAFNNILRKNSSKQKKLKQSEDALKKVLYFTPLGIILTNENNEVKLINKKALSIFEVEDESILLNQDIHKKLIFDKKKNVHIESVSKTSNKYTFTSSQYGKQIVISENIPIYNQNKKYFLNIYTEIKPSSLSVDEKNHFENERTTFIANISHELRTPLNSIIGMTDILGASSDIPSKEKEFIKIAKRSADTLLALINDILDFSKIRAGKLEIESIPIDLKEELTNIIDDLQANISNKGVKLYMENNIELPKAFLTDPLRLTQILNNLIGNAIKFTPQGKIILKISRTKILNGNPALQFAVCDTGIGIKKKKLDSIFHAFSQADSSTTRLYGGTGLGTTIAKNMVELMGGEIWAKSPSSISYNPELPGSEFIFSLPLELKENNKQLNFSYIRNWNQINCLLITDDELQVQTIIKNMVSFGISYRVMAPSHETILMLSKDKSFQFIVIDQRPDFDGIQFLQHLYNYNLHKEFLIMLQSSDFKGINPKFSKKLGADFYLRKPVKLNILKVILNNNFPSIIDQPTEIKQLPLELKILVAEDNIFNQKVAQNIFEKIGFEIDIANNGYEAINKSETTKYDIIFMDLMMPEMDGFEASKKIKYTNNSIPIIAMTANNDDAQKHKAFQSGMDDFIIKPAQKEEINRMIIKWCTI